MRLKARASVRSCEPQLGQTPVDLVGPPALVAVLAVDQGVGEGGQVARGLPDGGRAEDGGVEADHVVALLDHGAPPGVLDVAQHVDAERAVVVGGAEAAVDLGRGEDEAAVAAQPHHLLHQVVGWRPAGASAVSVIGAGYRSGFWR